MADHFSIEPAVEGVFERHGRTQVFVPKALAPATTYTVTLRKGLARTGTDLAMPTDVVFRFETEGPGTQQVRLQFGREVMETAPGKAPTVSIYALRPWVGDGQLPAPTGRRSGSTGSRRSSKASEALVDFLAAPHWAAYSDPLFPTDDLTLVSSFTARWCRSGTRRSCSRSPWRSIKAGTSWSSRGPDPPRRSSRSRRCRPGSRSWTIAPLPGSTTWSRTRRSKAPPWAWAAPRFATSDADGLAVGSTPRSLVPAAAGGQASAVWPVMHVTSPDGSTVLVPFNLRDDGPGYRGEWWETSGSADESYWSLLYTDRAVYRQTDHVDIWGYLRDRNDGAAPPSVELRLTDNRFGGGLDNDPTGIPIDRVVVQPGPDGLFTASIPITKLPLGGYSIQAVVGGTVVASHWLEVSVIRKPAYELRLTSDHAAVIAGTRVRFTATARFFEGTPVVGIPLNVSMFDPERVVALTTDAEGTASTTFVLDAPSGYRADPSALARPGGPEAGEISTSLSTIVFPSAYDVRAQAALAGDELRISGAIAAVDLTKVERELAAGTWEGDPSGRPVAGAVIVATITELVPTRRQVGNAYDFIEKVVRPVYEYDYDRRAVDPVTITSGSDGTFSISAPIPNGDHQYDIVLTAHDTAGRAQVTPLWAAPTSITFAKSGVEFRASDGRTGDEIPSTSVTWSRGEWSTAEARAAASCRLMARTATCMSSPSEGCEPLS